MYSEHMFTLQESHPLGDNTEPVTPVTPQLIWLRVSDGTVRRFVLDLENQELSPLQMEQVENQQELPLKSSNGNGATPSDGAAPKKKALLRRNQ